LNQAFRRRIAHTGVTPDQFTAMRTLLEGSPEGSTQRDLTQAMSSDPNTVASLLERMEEAGWVERRPHERDGRAYRIRLLPAGRERYEIVRDEAVAQYGLTACAIVHRLGEVAVGETSVAIATSAPHRRAAFAAAEWLMERIKEGVPIWKREEAADGSRTWIHPEARPESPVPERGP
jgi:DNA-binding MarR family transcriptional regulator